MNRLFFAAACLLAGAAAAGDDPQREAAYAILAPYAGESAFVTAPGECVNPDGLAGKVVCGYQGWFGTPGDGVNTGWRHYGRRGGFGPGRCGIDLWPDVADLDPADRVPTDFRRADGTAAEVFSSAQPGVVRTHFDWMRTYGIDGVFVQRFAVETNAPGSLNHFNTVLMNCREAANRSGRCYAVMYDLSGLPAGGTGAVIADWKQLVDRMKLGHEGDRAYLRHRGKPLVAVWGVGFNDARRYTPEECGRLIDFLKNDPVYGGNAVLVGVPTGWRTLDRDAAADPALHAVIQRADVVQPWTVGRYATPQQARRHAEQVVTADLAWCRDAGLDYLPVVFPGFSWHNLRPDSPTDQIPRRGGEFLWSQCAADKRAGATAIYVAMFDEMDEGTAIFKCSADPPVGDSPFVPIDAPADHYLWLTGQAGRMLRGEIPATAEPPVRTP